jgi:hypothetical protein
VGRVLDTQGNPIANAHVHNGRLDNPVTTATDSTGAFTLRCPDAQTNIPGAFAYGYRMVSPEPGFEIIVASGATMNLNFVLEPLPEIKVLVPETVTEGASNVVLSFTRTGPTNEALEVWFQLSGTAMLNTDYTGAVVSERVIIPAGSNAAVVPHGCPARRRDRRD